MISLPIAVNKPFFYPQISLFDYAYQRTQGTCEGANVLVADRNYFYETPETVLDLEIGVSHTMCKSYVDVTNVPDNPSGLHIPLNIQACVHQFIVNVDDNESVEILDCDMVHIKKKPDIFIPDDTIFVDSIYEDWHLFSKSSNKGVIDIYFENDGGYYNGGFVPIIGKAGTIKKILPEWINVHIDILKRDFDNKIKWWAGMYALQAACEKKKVQMIHKDFCYISGTNMRPITEETYIAHYSVDHRYNKKLYPTIDTSNFEDNVFYNIVKDWVESVWKKKR